MIDKILYEIISKDVRNNKQVAILLSGGVDSSSCLFTAKRLNLKIHAYTFYVNNIETYDSKKAEEICQKHNIKLTKISVSDKNIINDFKKLSTKYKCKKKTQFECTWPFLYVFPCIKEKVIISGVAADGHYGLSKSAMINHIHTKIEFDKFRKKYFSSDNPAGVEQLKMLSKEYNKILIAPYINEKVFNYFIQYDWSEINKPQEKYLIRKCFDEINDLNLKKQLNLQLVSNIPTVFEKLLFNKEINFKKRSRIMDICHDWSKQQLNLF